ncbi:stage V sporulation protein K [Alkalihalobacillus pseudalcaliphilus]|uniref:stage V sporulation protein K n=1 Tax=Alkalihalobacillus pseudalcaliphilus TaxID=79884 RepID=UPI00064E130C|nr:stage V sporulation protein K [Alkalihalobacillus pseudalcaliphilus]KMK76602.1 stage V sporulation protein K [Alkalihalobacillus pseudalcaliphilus]
MSNPNNTKKSGRINVVLNQARQERVKSKDIVYYSEEDKEKHEVLKKFERRMEKYVGLTEIKKLLKEIYAWIYVNHCREQQGLKTSKQVLHMLFKGNPGTGKTTVARIIAEFFHEMEVLEKGHLLEVERADLVGEYIGHTAQKTREVIKKASGGVLFVDEAYSLARGGEKDFGKEAIDTLVKAMEDQQHQFVLILAGYSREMDYFMSLNPGLPSRFPISIDFPNYTLDELLEILIGMGHEREYTLTAEALRHIKDELKLIRIEQERAFSNGRYIRNLVEEAIRLQAVRLLRQGTFDRRSLETLEADDFNFSSSRVQTK